MIHPTLILAAVGVTAGVAEILHYLRVRRVRNLAFGPGGGPRKWARWVPWISVASLSLFGWGLANLYRLEPEVSQKKGDLSDRDRNRILILYDVSPSMSLEDAGPHRDLSRRQRSAQLMDSMMECVHLNQALINVVALLL